MFVRCGGSYRPRPLPPPGARSSSTELRRPAICIRYPPGDLRAARRPPAPARRSDLWAVSAVRVTRQTIWIC
ncbi:hypothetical protein EVAR_21441_1 [Eumeta japonica]|uniref:Uncharacterized protein n=1 Tax=Eumeta variegata TaxID=151549 RepID=A0A4C1VJM1_EUMVA|nr:hypothetical protein EVAR_21441_1 [Eumeta japonica]